MNENKTCPDCTPLPSVDRRQFIKKAAAGAAGVVAASAMPIPLFAGNRLAGPETSVKALYKTLSEKQRQAICFDWNYQDPELGLLRSRISGNWSITDASVNSDFYSNQQQGIIRDIFTGLISPDWLAKVDQQLDDDCGGFGHEQSIAIFGKPGDGDFEFVIAGRHLTLRCDGNSADHVAFGGPIFYGHDPHGDFNESKHHPGNVYWEQALVANRVYQSLNKDQRAQARIAKAPPENRVAFKGDAKQISGVSVADLNPEQQKGVQDLLGSLIEPFRKSDQDEVTQCVNTQGGLEQFKMSYFVNKDIGNDQVWDVWRLEGPSFVWHFRGAPHVHVWVNVADSSTVKLNS